MTQSNSWNCFEFSSSAKNKKFDLCQPFEGSVSPIIHCLDGRGGEGSYFVDDELLDREAGVVASTPTSLRYSGDTNQQREEQHEQGCGECSSGGDGNTSPSANFPILSLPFSVPISAVRVKACFPASPPKARG